MRDIATIQQEISDGTYPGTYAEDKETLLKVENILGIEGNLIHWAASKSDNSNMDKFLRNIGDLGEGLKHELLNSKDANNKSVLMHAVSSPKKGNLDAIKSLLRSGADVNQADFTGIAPLTKAVSRGDVELTKILLENAVNLNLEFEDRYGNTALTSSLTNKKFEIASLLLQKGADVNKVDFTGATPLMKAVSKGDLELTKVLLENGVNLNLELEDGNGNTALILSLNNKKFEIASLLLQKGADVNKVDFTGATPLMKAVSKGDLELTKVLLENGVNLNLELEDGNGNTALILSLNNKKFEIASLLLQKGADVNKSDSQGRTPLMTEPLQGDVITVKWLLENGANANQADNMGRTPLTKALLKENLAMIECLMQNGANANQADNMGLTPLTKAILKGNLAMIECLLKNGANPNLVDFQGNTPLHYAKDKAIIKLFLDHKADFTIKNKDGFNVVDQMPPEEEFHKLLLKAFAVFDTFNGTIKAQFEVFKKEAQVVRTDNGRGANINFAQIVQEAYKEKPEEEYRRIKDIIELMDTTMKSNHEKLNDSTEIFYSGFKGHFTCFLVKKVETGYIVIECNRGVGSKTYGSGINIFNLPASMNYDTLVEKIKSIKAGDEKSYTDFIKTLGLPIHIQREAQAGDNCISESAKTLFEVLYALQRKDCLFKENTTREEIENAIISNNFQYKIILDQVKDYYFKKIFDLVLAAKPDSIDRENAINFFLSVFITKVPEYKEHLSPFTIEALENLRKLNAPGLVKKLLDEKAKTVDYSMLSKVHQQMIAAVVDKIDRESTLRDNTEHTVADLETIGTPEVIGHLGGEDVGLVMFY